MLRSALQNVFDDPSFRTKSQEAANARIGTEYMLQWCSNRDNLPTLLKFTEDLVKDLEGALVKPNGKVLRDKVWESYFYIRSQEAFTNRWTVFLCSANSPIGTPVLYQHLTDIIFKELLREKYSVSANDRDSERPGPLTVNEVNVLRYVAGYVCRHLRKKIEASSHPLKEDMVLCIMTMVKDFNTLLSGPCEEWTDLVACGMFEKIPIPFSCAWKKKYVLCFHLC